MSIHLDHSEVVQVLADGNHRREFHNHTLELLSDAAQLAKRLDGRVGAWVLAPSQHNNMADSETDLTPLALHGCHVVRWLHSDRFASWSSEAVAASLGRNLSSNCRVVLLPGTSRGEETAALLAEHLETEWIPDALTLSVTRTGALEVTAIQPAGTLSQKFRAMDARPVVVTMRPGVAEACPLEQPVEFTLEEILVDLSDIPILTSVEEFLPADPKTIDITFARRIVSGGRGTGGPDGMRLVARLAESLEASLAASRVAVDLGWAPAERQVGQTGKTVRPDLYVACGISGASHHLSGMRGSQHVVAINTDSMAPIHQVAHLSLFGDLHQMVPAIVAAIRRRQQSQRSDES